MDTASKVKLALTILLGAAWGLLTYYPPAGNPAGAADLIGWIKVALGSIGTYHMGDIVKAAMTANATGGGSAPSPSAPQGNPQ